MNFLKRLKFYIIGFILGLFLIYSLFKEREWDWLPENKIKKFHSKSVKIRADIIDMLFKAQSGHSGPSLSIVEILNYLFFEKKIYKNFNDRDHFILSKGHAVPALY